MVRKLRQWLNLMSSSGCWGDFVPPKIESVVPLWKPEKNRRCCVWCKNWVIVAFYPERNKSKNEIGDFVSSYNSKPICKIESRQSEKFVLRMGNIIEIGCKHRLPRTEWDVTKYYGNYAFDLLTKGQQKLSDFFEEVAIK